MKHYLFKKAITLTLSLLVVVTVAFLLMKSAPGDPFQYEQALPEEIYQQLATQHGLRAPLLIQYVGYLKQLVSLDFGHSLIYKERKVWDMIADGFPTSALLGFEALFLCVPLGIFAGVTAAVLKRGWLTNSLIFMSVLTVSIPSFILATLLQYGFAISLDWLPIARWGSFFHTILPALSLAVMPMAFIARLAFTRTAHEMKQSYVMAAIAKGLPLSYIVKAHVLRNVLVPICGYLAPLIANILTGSFVIEKLFAIPGLGFWFVTSVLNRDYPLIMGITVFYCFLILMITLIVDLLSALLDPRLVRERSAR